MPFRRMNKKSRPFEISFDGILSPGISNVGEENVSTVKDFIWNISACFFYHGLYNTKNDFISFLQRERERGREKIGKLTPCV